MMTDKHIIDKMALEQSRFYDAFRELFTNGRTAGKSAQEIIQLLMFEAAHVMFTSELIDLNYRTYYLQQMDSHDKT